MFMLNLYRDLISFGKMALQNWNGNNYLRRIEAIIAAYPLVISLWVNRASTTGSRYLCSLSPNATRQGLACPAIEGSNNAAASVYDGTTFSEALTSTTVALTTWAHIGSEFISTTSRACLLNGAGRGTDTTSSNPTTDRFVVGGYGAGPLFEFPGTTDGIAEISLWNGTGMTSGNMDSLISKLALGGNPLNITAETAQPWTGLLVAYWKLLNSTDLGDYSGNGHDLTAVGTVTNFSSHPVIDIFPLPTGLAPAYFNQFPKPILRTPLTQGRLI